MATKYIEAKSGTIGQEKVRASASQQDGVNGMARRMEVMQKCTAKNITWSDIWKADHCIQFLVQAVNDVLPSLANHYV